uniref:Heat shock factor 2-binding protein n=1 Tax=Timema genevievae TaxID=629358 RepID=A0A7R9PKV4_TIMGE|nr:unnamed protein product [Timema genevievae]
MRRWPANPESALMRCSMTLHLKATCVGHEKVCNVLEPTVRDLYELLSAFSNPPICLELEQDLLRLQRETRALTENIEFMIGTQHDTTQAMANMHAKSEELKTKYRRLQTEWDSQQEHMGKMQAELFQLRTQMQQQSQFCASLGAVMGNLLWKSSRLPSVVDLMLSGSDMLQGTCSLGSFRHVTKHMFSGVSQTCYKAHALWGQSDMLQGTCSLGSVRHVTRHMLSGNKVVEFLSIMNGSLVSFLETYNTNMPASSTDESQFIMSLCGVVTNIAASPAGRQFLATNEKGKELVAQIIRILPGIPTPAGNCLKRLLLMTVYNVSINQCGLSFLQEQKELSEALSHGLRNDTSQELKLMSLRVLQSLTYEMEDLGVLRDLERILPLPLIEDMTVLGDPEMKTVAKDILGNLDRARMNLVPNSSRETEDGYRYHSRPMGNNRAPLTSRTSRNIY